MAAKPASPEGRGISQTATRAEKAVQRSYFSRIVYRDPRDPVVSAYADPKLKFLWDHVKTDGGILDVGCGNGTFTLRLSQWSATVVGLDQSLHLLSHNAHKPLVVGDSTSLPFRSGAFDLVFEANVLHHVGERSGMVRELARVSRRYVAILEPNRINPVMFLFALLVRAERGVLASSVGRLTSEIGEAGLRMRACITTGMISQNNTPRFLIPVLRRFD